MGHCEAKFGTQRGKVSGELHDLGGKDTEALLEPDDRVTDLFERPPDQLTILAGLFERQRNGRQRIGDLLRWESTDATQLQRGACLDVGTPEIGDPFRCCERAGKLAGHERNLVRHDPSGRRCLQDLRTDLRERHSADVAGLLQL